MKTLLESNPLSRKDLRRLEKSFFSSPSLPKDRKKQKKLIFILGLASAFILAIILVTYNFNILALPRVRNLLGSRAIDLLHYKNLTQAELFPSQENAKIFKNLIYLNIPKNREAGFMFNFKDEMDMSGAKIVLLVKNPHPDFVMDLILRDKRFFSNAPNPIRIEVPVQDKKSNYDKIFLRLENQVDSYINSRQINQARFIFHQQKTDSLPLLINNVFFEKGGIHK